SGRKTEPTPTSPPWSVKVSLADGSDSAGVAQAVERESLISFVFQGHHHGITADPGLVRNGLQEGWYVQSNELAAISASLERRFATYGVAEQNQRCPFVFFKPSVETCNGRWMFEPLELVREGL